MSEKGQTKLIKKKNNIFKGLQKKKKLSQKGRKITLSLILKMLLTLVGYIVYPRYIAGSVTYWDVLLFQTVVTIKRRFWSF